MIGIETSAILTFESESKTLGLVFNAKDKELYVLLTYGNGVVMYKSLSGIVRVLQKIGINQQLICICMEFMQLYMCLSWNCIASQKKEYLTHAFMPTMEQ